MDFRPHCGQECGPVSERDIEHFDVAYSVLPEFANMGVFWIRPCRGRPERKTRFRHACTGARCRRWASSFESSAWGVGMRIEYGTLSWQMRISRAFALGALVLSGSAWSQTGEVDEAVEVNEAVMQEKRVRAQVSVRDADEAKPIVCRYTSAGPDPGCVIEITNTLTLEFDDFDATQTTAVEVTEPDGRLRSYRVQGASLGLFLEPGTALGYYRFSARQSEAHAVDGAFSVHAAGERTVLARQFSITAGESLDIMLAGFHPSDSVLLHLYRYSGVSTSEGEGKSSLFDYVTTLGHVQIDQRGEGVVVLDTPRDDPTGRYLLISEPPALRRDALTNQFWLLASEDDQSAPASISATAEAATLEAIDAPPVDAQVSDASAAVVAERPEVCGRARIVGVTALSMRARPTRASDRVGTVSKGRGIDLMCAESVNADERTWLRVRSSQGRVGWMSDRYLERLDVGED